MEITVYRTYPSAYENRRTDSIRPTKMLQVFEPYSRGFLGSGAFTRIVPHSTRGVARDQRQFKAIVFYVNRTFKIGKYCDKINVYNVKLEVLFICCYKHIRHCNTS